MKEVFTVVIALCIIFPMNFESALGCPQKCLCQKGTVRCIRQQLKVIPELPADTNTVDLRFNNIEEIPSNGFRGLRHLHSIFLNENKIKNIHKNAFTELPALRYLYLNQNNINNISSNAFVNLYRLERLNLYGNKILRIPFGTFDNMNSLRTLRLDSNLLECDCSMMWLMKHLRSKRGQLDASANCRSPIIMEGKNLADMSEEDMIHCKKPVILQDPSNFDAAFGSNVVLKCKADGYPTPDIKWMLNSNEIEASDSRVRVEDDGTLRINRVSDRDQGMYTCMATNDMGEAISREAQISIQQGPQSEQSGSQSAQLHLFFDEFYEHITMFCEVKGIEQPQISWTLNEKFVRRSTQRIRIYENGTLIIQNPSEEDEGIYNCEATSYLGSSIFKASSSEISVPVIKTSPEKKKVKTGANVTLFCDAEANPEPHIFWSKDEQLLSFTNRVFLLTDNKTLNIDHIKESDSGIYACIAENILGSDEASAEVEVTSSNGHPKLIFEPYDLEAIPGTTIELLCGSEGDPVPLTKWKKDGRTLTKSFKYNVSPGSGSLFISNINEFDAGRYECTVSNDFGRVTASCVVSVRKREDLAPGDKFFRAAFAEASNEIDSAINQTVAALFTSNSSAPKNHGDLFRIVRFPTGPARELARASEIYERTLVNIQQHINAGMNLETNVSSFTNEDLLSPDYLELLAQLSDCTAHRITPNCTDICYHGMYRTIDGSCNNFENPLWGSSLSAFRRLLPPMYENGFNSPIGWNREKKYNGFKLPSPRFVSTNLISTDTIEQDSQITHMVMQWGQFLDHDLDHALPAVSSESWDGIDCKKSCEQSPPCYPIEVPENDPRVTNRRCIDFIRSSATCGSGMTSVFFGKIQPREQINQLTSFIDASQVYGYSLQFSRDLRNISLEGEDNGFLREGVRFPDQKPMLPFAAPTDGIDCRRNLAESSVNCFTAGDIRVNEQVGLLAMHTIFMREHNRIAKFFNEINPHWDGEKVYQETRKIVGAQMQHITFKHWLPKIIGGEGMQILGEYKGYNPSENPSISNEFATAALRFGHSLINPILHRLDWNFEPIEQGHLPLHHAFFAPWRVVHEGGVDPLLRGLISVPAKLKKPNQNLNSDLTEKLFTTAHAVSLDLAAINMQRGRDHAIRSYMQYRKFCNLPTSESFDGLVDITNQNVRDKLKESYGHPDNIDIWTGGILEDQLPGAKVGPLFRCLLIEQMRKLRDGDRFYYENPSVFKTEQLDQIKVATLGRILCDNGDNITSVQSDVFILPELQGGRRHCDLISNISLRVWTDCSDCSRRSAYNIDTTTLLLRNRFRRDLKTESKAYDDENTVELNDEHEAITKDFVAMSEERIEGLESVIQTFQETLQKMSQEIKYLNDVNKELVRNMSKYQPVVKTDGI